MKVLSGEVDFISYGTGGVTAANLPLYKENAEAAGYTVHLLGVHNTPTNVWLNLTYDDPVWRQVVGDVRFRRALNMAINRDEIIEAVYYGLASKPWQIPSEYDPAQAEAMLDEIGLDQRDADGWRLGPDGNTFEIPFDVAPGLAEDIMPVAELVSQYWNEVGIKTSIKSIETGLRSQRWTANEQKLDIIWNATLTMWWQIWGMSIGNFAPLWNQWLNSSGETGEEPPEEIKRFFELVNESVAVNPESPRRQEIIDEYLAILYDQIYCMTTVSDVSAPLILHKDIKNVATAGFAIAAYYAAEQWYYDV
jgi:peptide/nickel transport system substrate-binding protein